MVSFCTINFGRIAHWLRKFLDFIHILIAWRFNALRVLENLDDIYLNRDCSMVVVLSSFTNSEYSMYGNHHKVYVAQMFWNLLFSYWFVWQKCQTIRQYVKFLITNFSKLPFYGWVKILSWIKSALDSDEYAYNLYFVVRGCGFVMIDVVRILQSFFTRDGAMIQTNPKEYGWIMWIHWYNHECKKVCIFYGILLATGERYTVVGA